MRSLVRSSVLSVLLFASAVLTQAAVPDGRVAYWSMNSISPDNLLLDEANTNHLKIVGPVITSPGQIGNAYTLATNTYITNIHGSEDLPTDMPVIPGTAYTISFWIKAPPQTNRYIFSHGATNNQNPLLILQSGAGAGTNRLDVIIRPDSGAAQVNHVISSSVIFDDEWHHVTWIDENGQVRLYIDGLRDAANFNYTPAGTFTFHTTAIGTLVRAAVAPVANSLIGQLDEFQIWKRALTYEEAMSLVTPQTPISLLAQPGDQTRKNGDWANFSVTHKGTGPVDYQWYKNGQIIPDATNRTYQATGLIPSNTGDYYYVAVTNALGGLVTTNATLTVLADPAPDLRDQLNNYWPLDNIEQVEADLISPDLYSGNGMVLRNFVDVNDKVEGKFGSALFFDSTQNKYSHRTNGPAAASSTNFTVAMWVKGSYIGQNDRRVFSEGSSTADAPLFTIGTEAIAQPQNPGASVLIRSDANSVLLARRTTRAVFDDTWHHIAWSDNNGDARFYVDGVLDESDFRYTRSLLTLNRTSLGAVVRAAVGNFYFGNIDEVAVWRRALSATEIQQVVATGVPAPISVIAPDVVTQPAQMTNNVFIGDTVTFHVQASGTEPLEYQWFRDNVAISLASNASAGSDSLSITNVQVADSGSTFKVRVKNSAGEIFSQEVGLAVSTYTPATSGEVLHLDIGLSGTANVQPGFDNFTLAMNGTNFNGIGVTLSGINGTSLAERNRTATPWVTNNPPLMTQAQIYNDFVFANSATDGTGLRILIERLAPNTKYAVTIWSFDAASTGARFADWSETYNPENIVPIQSQYSFDGSVLPTNDNDRTLGGLLTSSANGKLQIDGIKNGGTGFGAFLNAIRLVANPAPVVKSIALGVDTVIFKIDTLSTGTTVTVEERPDIATGVWTEAVATVTDQNGSIVTVTVPYSPGAPQMFYRVALTP